MRRLTARPRLARAAALLAIAGTAFAVQPTALKVLRTSPAEIGARDTMLIVFDRPVAGSLDYSADPAEIVRIAPAIDARIEWRDPVTLRVVPRTQFALATRYTVTVANRFRAMDGSVLAGPYRYVARVRGPTLENRPDTLRQLPRTPRFRLTWSHPVNAQRVARLAALRLTSACNVTTPGLRVASSEPRAVVLEALAPLPL
ncbi:MAG: Ig-like domain-containing protein, partial [Gemmatimonadaceae bacterium]|nr:Ig-like domain-containing protein [Gemmatimonadaceae bacterium]